MHWKPAETAPMDIDLLLYWSAEFPMDIGLRCETGWQRANDDMAEYDAPPKFWTMLPEPPNNQAHLRERSVAK